MMPADKHCTDEQLEFYLYLTNEDLKPNTGRYARICSTYRTQYYKNGGTEAVSAGLALGQKRTDCSLGKG